MILNLEPGKYVAAVSGGVDSMALLHLLHEAAQQDDRWQITVAHLDHGIRPKSVEDRRLVQEVAESYGLQFIYKKAHLGAGTSEATAREIRYKFLRKVLAETGAQAIITAHHQDDLLETAILNLIRGTGRRGLTALSDRPDIVRPLLDIPKAELVAYAKKHNLEWHEDATNTDTTYLRNYIRHNILPRFDDASRQHFLEILKNLSSDNKELDQLLAAILPRQQKLDRKWFCSLSHHMSLEVMAAWLRQNGISNYDRKMLDRLTIAAKVTHAGRQIDILEGRTMVVQKDLLALSNIER